MAVGSGTTVHLSTFRPLAAGASAAATPPAGNKAGPQPSQQQTPLAPHHGETSDYENLSSYTSGRFATLPSHQVSHGSSQDQHHQHHQRAGEYSAATLRLGRPSHPLEGTDVSFQTVSLHRPVKRPHWLNHNGRPSDVLARVLHASNTHAADWPYDESDGLAPPPSSAAKSDHRIRTSRTRYPTNPALRSLELVRGSADESGS